MCNEEHTVIDDNRKDGKPMELIFGKKFKLEAWETCLKSMRPREVASFVVDPSVSIQHAVDSQLISKRFGLKCNY